METTSVSLLERLRQPGDKLAWDRFVQLYTPLLCRWAGRLGLRQQDVTDLVQEVFALLVRKMPEFQYNPHKRFRGWLWTVTLNKCRELHRRAPTPTQQAPDELLAEVPGREDAEAVAEAEYRQYLVARALQLMRDEFEPTTWQAFWQCVTAGRPAAEVGAELGLSVGAVYAAKSRVLQRLRRELDGLLD
jgi:RNA polymerase sigma-70 factor (ECF subfamily)